MSELGMGIINNDSLLMGIKNRKLWAKFYIIQMFALIILTF